jgi:hypothetical protein
MCSLLAIVKREELRLQEFLFSYWLPLFWQIPMIPAPKHEGIPIQLLNALFAKAPGDLYSVLHKLPTSFSRVSPELRLRE